MNNFKMVFMKTMNFFIMVATLVLATTTMVFSQEKGTNPSTYDEGVVINGVKWATRNVGAPGTFAAKPESYGLFYQWGSNVGWSTTDPLTATDGYNTWDELYEKGDTWTDDKSPCPTGWRLPTIKELTALVNAGYIWTTVNGVRGRLFGSGDNRLFLPASGYRHYLNGKENYVGSSGNYWSSTVFRRYAYYLKFNNSTVYPNSNSPRANGYSVRCVAE
jgi:uncharacterized protein (TIGR02145 family)